MENVDVTPSSCVKSFVYQNFCGPHNNPLLQSFLLLRKSKSQKICDFHLINNLIKVFQYIALKVIKIKSILIHLSHFYNRPYSKMRENFGYHLIKPRYYDQPEGQDLFGKLVITNAYMVTFGAVWSTYDVLMITKPQGYFNTFSRFAYHTGPFMGMATAFTLTTYMANKFRGKDDTYVKLKYY